jgi:tetratricopeptide (TPR) repeat protein
MRIRDRRLRAAKEKPTEELLTRVRGVTLFRMEMEPRKARTTREGGRLRAQVAKELMAFLEGLGLQVLHKKDKGLLRREPRLAHRVVEGKDVRLDFVDRIEDAREGQPTALLAIRKYRAGPWEEKVGQAYEKCSELREDLNQLGLLEKRLSGAGDAAEVVNVMKATGNEDRAIQLLALSDQYEANSYTVYMSYVMSGRIGDAYRALRSILELNPEDARLHLALGNFYWASLCNVLGWSPEANPGPLRKITLQALGCNQDQAKTLAENHFVEAMRLAGEAEVRNQANEQLTVLRSLKQ